MQKHQSIPDGQAFVEGRGRDRAIALIEAAEAAGYGAETVRTQFGGYLVPSAVAEQFDAAQSDATATHTATPDETEPSTEAQPLGAGESNDEPEAPKAPGKSATKAKWVEFAVAESARRGEPLTQEQAEELTQAELIERFGATE